MIIKGLLFGLTWIVPLFAGGLFIPKKQTAIGIPDMLKNYLFGLFLLWGIFQILSVSLVRMKVSFSLLYYSFLGIAVCLSGAGAWRIFRRKVVFKRISLKSPAIWIVLVITVALISYQVVMYVFGQHLDEDDARWIAESNDALVYNTMFLNNPSTGGYFGTFVGDMVRDSISPWPMYISVLSKFTGIRPATMAHTLLAPTLLLLAYMIYYRIGSLLFEHTEERIFFLLAVSVIMLFFYGDRYSEATFSLIRIWQGKAVVAGVAIPALFSQFLAIHKEDDIRNWLILMLMGCASCLFSGMGIVISIVVIGGYGLYFVLFRNWKRIPLWILAILPSVVFEMINLKLT